MTRKKITVRLSEELNNSIKTESKKNGTTQNQLINNAIQYYFKHNGVDFPNMLQVLGDGFEIYYEPIGDELKRMRHALNQLNKESKMNKEFWNHHFFHKGNGTLMTTDVNKSNEIANAEANMKNKILKQQQEKHS